MEIGSGALQVLAGATSLRERIALPSFHAGGRSDQARTSRPRMHRGRDSSKSVSETPLATKASPRATPKSRIPVRRWANILAFVATSCVMVSTCCASRESQ
jgi:hypothetical protein